MRVATGAPSHNRLTVAAAPEDPLPLTTLYMNYTPLGLTAVRPR